VSGDAHDEGGRIADDARRKAREARAVAKARTKADTAHTVAEAFTGEGGEEAVEQLGLIYGGLIGIALIMVQPRIVAPSIDLAAQISVVAFSVAIPLLAALVLVNRQESFRGRRTPSISVRITHGVAQSAAFVGIAAGWWRLERDRARSRGDAP
jgi:hypothetical protein